MSNKTYVENEIRGLMTSKFTTLEEKKAILNSWIEAVEKNIEDHRKANSSYLSDILMTKDMYIDALVRLNTMKTKDQLAKGDCIAIDEDGKEYRTNYTKVMCIVPSKKVISYLQ